MTGIWSTVEKKPREALVLRCPKKPMDFQLQTIDRWRRIRRATEVTSRLSSLVVVFVVARRFLKTTVTTQLCRDYLLDYFKSFIIGNVGGLWRLVKVTVLRDYVVFTRTHLTGHINSVLHTLYTLTYHFIRWIRISLLLHRSQERTLSCQLPTWLPSWMTIINIYQLTYTAMISACPFSSDQDPCVGCIEV